MAQSNNNNRNKKQVKLFLKVVQTSTGFDLTFEIKVIQNGSALNAVDVELKNGPDVLDSGQTQGGVYLNTIPLEPEFAGKTFKFRACVVNDPAEVERPVAFPKAEKKEGLKSNSLIVLKIPVNEWDINQNYDVKGEYYIRVHVTNKDENSPCGGVEVTLSGSGLRFRIGNRYVKQNQFTLKTGANGIAEFRVKILKDTQITAHALQANELLEPEALYAPENPECKVLDTFF